MNEVFKIDHPLFKEINTKFLKNNPNSNKKKFDVELSDDEKKLIITNNGKTEEYNVFKKIIDYTSFRCIHPDFKCINPDNKKEFNAKKILRIIEDDEKIFKIIENDQQILRIIENDQRLYNFNNKNFDRYIFLEEISNSYKTIVNKGIKLSFEQSIFKDKCNFNRLKINKTYFKNCIFLNKTNFQESTLKNNENIISPSRYITFSDSAFLDHADFMFTKFESDAFFENCIFKSASFSCLEFKQYTSFKNSKFVESLNLSNSKINKMILTNTKIELLHLTDVDIENYINCENIEIEDAVCRETFRTLKENCIKKYDFISALYLHTKEIDKHRRTLKLKKNFIEKFILSLEKVMSNYGTNPFLAMGWLLLIHLIDKIIRILFSDSYAKLKTDFNIYNLNIIENYSSIIGFWFLFKIILSSVLIYEIIKSFRMFSRKL